MSNNNKYVKRHSTFQNYRFRQHRYQVNNLSEIILEFAISLRHRRCRLWRSERNSNKSLINFPSQFSQIKK